MQRQETPYEERLHVGHDRRGVWWGRGILQSFCAMLKVSSFTILKVREP